MTNEYALPPRVAVVGANYAEAVRHIKTLAPRFDDAVFVAISATAHPGTVAGMRVTEIIEAPGAYCGFVNDKTIEYLNVALERGAQ